MDYDDRAKEKTSVPNKFFKFAFSLSAVRGNRFRVSFLKHYESSDIVQHGVTDVAIRAVRGDR